VALISFRGSPHGGSQRLLPEWRSQGRITPIAIIDHSIVGSAVGAWLLFRDASGLESHFIVRGRRSGAEDGHIWQLMDTGRRADANRDANGYAISIETEDDGDPDTQPWTRAQLQSLAWLHNKLRSVHPSIPRRASRSCSDPAGLGYHALALHTEIPTTRGLRPLSDIAVGDEVFDELGKPCRVTNVTDLWPERCWRLLFSDGAEVLASGEHLWVTWTANERHHYFRRGGKRYERRGPKPEGFPPNWAAMRPVRTTDQLVATIQGRRGWSNHAIPLTRPLQGPPHDLPVDPYVLGVWLGDGSSQEATIYANAGADGEFIAGQIASAGYRIGAWGAKPTGRSAWFGVLGLKVKLRELGVIGDKHIPPRYLYASAEQRLALLQGLMDTDGTADQHGRVMFSTVSERMAEQVLWLASSLGQKPVHYKPQRRTGTERSAEYRLQWTATASVFRMPRKLTKLAATSTSQLHARMLIRAEPVPLQPMRCLTVDSPNSMYLATAWCIPTHNTLHGAPSCWTPVAKTCPGAVRKRQWRDVLLPAFLAGQTLEDEMPLDRADKDAIRSIVQAELEEFRSRRPANLSSDPDNKPLTLGELAGAFPSAGVPGVRREVDAIKATLDAGVLVKLTPDQLASLAEALAPLVAAKLEVEGIAEAVADELAQRLAQ
jgi:N-acetylmuramoyl-L-alanine amidase/LAGLIDADG-like domain